MENWLSCNLSLGQFEGEFGVDGEQYDKTPFSLFVPASAAKYDKPPRGNNKAPGWVKVEVLERKGDLILVRLPRQTFQGPPFITVREDQLEKSVPQPKRATAKPRHGSR
jgi:hypothetical protein